MDTIDLPANPTHGMTVQVNDGLYLQYDAGTKGWFRIVSDGILVPASFNQDGTMSAEDFKKLNRMLLPPPMATIKGEECSTPFSKTGGHINLYPSDFIKVNGKLALKNKVAPSNPSAEYPFKIHRNTSGFDFDVDADALAAYFVSTGQIPTQIRGEKGEDGDVGEQGVDGRTLLPVATGPKGKKGAPGTTPACTISIETENFTAKLKPGNAKVAVDARIERVEGSDTDYVLVVDRKLAAPTGLGASHLNVKDNESPWVLVVATNTNAPQVVYYLDMSTITDAVYSKYLDEVDRLKAGYEAVTEFWLKTMSTEFDSQKAALCCALEYCESQLKNAQSREHLENIAATIADRGLKMNIHTRKDGGGVTVPVGPNCTNENTEETEIEQPTYRIYDSSQAIVRTQDGSVVNQKLAAQSVSKTLDVDPLINVGSSTRGAVIDLAAGTYVATIQECCPEFDGLHCLPLRIAFSGGVTKFPDYGTYASLADAKEAYAGKSVQFTHTGGPVTAYYSVMPSANASGIATVSFEPVEAVVAHSPNAYYELDAMVLAKLDRASGPGGLLRAPGQEYIVVRSADVFIDGLSDFSLAWPTLDGVSFADVPVSGVVRFKANPNLNALVRVQLGPDLGTTLFPVYEA